MTWPLATSSCTCWLDTSPCSLMSLDQKTFVLLSLTASCLLLFLGGLIGAHSVLCFINIILVRYQTHSRPSIYPDCSAHRALSWLCCFVNMMVLNVAPNIILLHWIRSCVFSSKENVHRHTLRMLVHLHHKVLPSYMETLMKTLEPPKQVGFIFLPPAWCSGIDRS